MSKLFKSAKKHSHAKANFRMGDENHELLVQLFSESDYSEQLKIFETGHNELAAETLASYFLDPETLKPAITKEELLSSEWKNADSMRLFDLFVSVNTGQQGN